jgi:chromosome segregation ATPase
LSFEKGEYALCLNAMDRTSPQSRDQPPSPRIYSQSQPIVPSTKNPLPLSLFSPGMIYQLRLRDFMSFDRIVLNMIPGVHLILGPNGSGKSSFIAAIGLVFGLKPQQILKNSNYGTYVRHSAQSSTIKITLSANAILKIQLELFKNEETKWSSKSGKSSWLPIKKSDVEEICQRLNIKVDSLCMFLPQERVKEFSLLKPRQFLKETLRVVSDQLFNEFRQFKEDEDSIKKDLNDLKELKRNYSESILKIQLEIRRRTSGLALSLLRRS